MGAHLSSSEPFYGQPNVEAAAFRVCHACGAIVHPDMRDVHNEFHAAVAATARQVVNLDHRTIGSVKLG